MLFIRFPRISHHIFQWHIIENNFWIKTKPEKVHEEDKRPQKRKELESPEAA